jgi:TRAP-type C4-dicarboxylate transport system permease small subunit
MLHFFSDKINDILRICGYFISILVSSIFTWEMFSYTLHATKIKKTALSSSLPFYPFCWVAVVGIVLLLIVYIYKLILCFSKEGDVL